MDLNVDYPALQHDIKEARTLEAMEAALAKVVGLTPTVIEPANFGLKLFTPGLDRLVPDIARRLRLDDLSTEKSNDKVCILATQFYGTGGHTRVARDFATGLGPDERPLVILTNTWGGNARYRGLFQNGKLGSAFNDRAFLVLSGPTFVEKTFELYMMLKAARPSRIILMCHPFDIVSIVAAWPFRDIVEFVHHADHVPAVGASLAWSAHVDLTYTCHLACRESGLDAVYAGMTSAVVGAPAHTRDPNRLRLATCGDARKYSGSGAYRWIDYAVAAMRQPGAEMLHIGEMPADFQQEVHGALSAAGLDPAHYVFAGAKPSLPAALIEHQTDVYLSSYPASGGKTNLEAMLADRPVVVPIDPDMKPLLHFRIPLTGCVEIRGPDELAKGVSKALDLPTAMQVRERERIVAREIGRFADFVAGRQLEPVLADAVSPD